MISDDEFSEVIAMLSGGEVDVAPLISHRFPYAMPSRPSPGPRTPHGRPRL